MNFLKRKLATATVVGAILGVGGAGQASADVYGLAYLDIDDLIVTTPATATVFTFGVDQEARLNNVADPVDGGAVCGGVFGVFNDCGVAPRLSGPAQNAPPASAGIRGNSMYTAFGQVGSYSNSEAEIIDAVLLLDGDTHVAGISESNLETSGTARSSTSVDSNTSLRLLVAGSLNLRFNATFNVQAEVTGPELGVAQAAISATLTLTDAAGNTLVSWTPDGSGAGVLGGSDCDGSLVCSVLFDPTRLTFTATAASSGALSTLIGSGFYEIDITGLTPGEYGIALASTTQTNLRAVPVPGTLLLVGTGLLLGARAARRSKS